MKALDTTAIIDFLRGSESARHLKNTMFTEQVVTTRISFFEVLVGIFSLKQGFSREMRVEEVIEFFNKIEILELDEKSAVLSAEILGKLNREGNPIEPNDCLIAGIALSNRIDTIISKNVKDFQGLKVESY